MFDIKCNIHNDCKNYHTTIYKKKFGNVQNLNSEIIYLLTFKSMPLLVLKMQISILYSFVHLYIVSLHFTWLYNLLHNHNNIIIIYSLTKSKGIFKMVSVRLSVDLCVGPKFVRSIIPKVRKQYSANFTQTDRAHLEVQNARAVTFNCLPIELFLLKLTR
jgi:hypothetical protein